MVGSYELEKEYSISLIPSNPHSGVMIPLRGLQSVYELYGAKDASGPRHGYFSTCDVVTHFANVLLATLCRLRFHVAAMLTKPGRTPVKTNVQMKRDKSKFKN